MRQLKIHSKLGTNIHYVYRHIRLDKNVPFYIGKGTHVSNSKKKGKYDRAYTKHERNSHWNRIVAKVEYEVEILVDNLNWDEAIEKEKEFIRLYGRRHNKTGTLVNLTDGGEGMLGWVCPQEIKERFSRERKGKPGKNYNIITEEFRERMRMLSTGNKYCVGRVLSEETKRKLSVASTGQKPNNNIPVVQYTKRGIFVKEHNSADRAGREMGEVNGGNITMACKGRRGRKTAKGFMWRYKTSVLNESGRVMLKIDALKEKFSENQKLEISKSDLSNVALGKIYNTSSTTIFYIKKKYKEK